MCACPLRFAFKPNFCWSNTAFSIPDTFPDECLKFLLTFEASSKVKFLLILYEKIGVNDSTLLKAVLALFHRSFCKSEDIHAGVM